MLTAKERHAVEMGKKHIVFEKENSFKPNPMILLKEVSKLFHIYLNQNIEDGTRESRRMILRFLEKEKGLCQQDIVNLSHLSAPAVSNELWEMEKEGLIKREKDEKDARHMRISLTPLGEEKNKEYRKAFDNIADTALSSVSEEEKDFLYRILYKVRGDILEKIKEERKKENEK